MREVNIREKLDQNLDREISSNVFSLKIDMTYNRNNDKIEQLLSRREVKRINYAVFFTFSGAVVSVASAMCAMDESHYTPSKIASFVGSTISFFSAAVALCLTCRSSCCQSSQDSPSNSSLNLRMREGRTNYGMLGDNKNEGDEEQALLIEDSKLPKYS